MKKLLTCALILLILTTLTAPVLATDGSYPRLIDDAGVIDDITESALCGTMDTISESIEMDVCAILVDSLNGENIEAAADRLYEGCGYGFGADRSGFLLVVSISDGEWYVSAAGRGIDYLTYRVLNEVENVILPFLRDGDFGGAVNSYAECIEKISHEPIDNPIESTDNGMETQSEKFTLGTIPRLVVSLLVGLVSGAIGTGANKSKLKSVHSKNAARDYMVDGSFQLYRNQDMFLYRTVNRRPRPKENDRGGPGSSGSSGRPAVHVSAGGMKHSGGGGKF